MKDTRVAREKNDTDMASVGLGVTMTSKTLSRRILNERQGWVVILFVAVFLLSGAACASGGASSGTASSAGVSVEEIAEAAIACASTL